MAGGFEEVEGADGVGVEVVEGDGGSAVVGGLRGGVDDDGGADGFDEGEDAGAIADVEFVVDEAGELGGEAGLVPAGVARRAEEDGALVVVDAVDGVAEFAGEIDADFGADEAGGTGDEERFGHRGKVWAGVGRARAEERRWLATKATDRAVGKDGVYGRSEKGLITLCSSGNRSAGVRILKRGGRGESQSG